MYGLHWRVSCVSKPWPHWSGSVVELASRRLHLTSMSLTRHWPEVQTRPQRHATAITTHVTLKCLPHEKKYARGKIITHLICLLIRISPAPSKSLPIIGSPQKSLSPADNLPVKKSPWRGGFLPINYWPGRLFWGAIL